MSVTALLADRKNTRVALAAALVEANAEREALRAALSLARVELASAKNALALTEQFAEDCSNLADRQIQELCAKYDALYASMPRTTAPKAARQLPPHFVAAREAAMRLGRVVRVGA